MKDSRSIWFTALVAMSIVLASPLSRAVIEEMGFAFGLSTGETWTADSAVTYIPTGDTGLTVAFTAGRFPSGGASKGTVVVDAEVEGSAFKGNFVEAAINSLRLDVTGDGQHPYAKVLLQGDVYLWAFVFDIAALDGVQQTVTVPLVLADGWDFAVWKRTNKDINKQAAFAGDLLNVQSIAIELLPGKPDDMNWVPAQAYTIDNVVVINNDGISSPKGSLSGLEKGLIARFGYGYGTVDSLTAAMKLWDTDQDGMMDYVEIWAENDKPFAESIFLAKEIAVGAGGVTITWACVAGETYTVLRSDSVSVGFLPVAGLTTVVATETGYLAGNDSSAQGVSGTAYYRILKHSNTEE